MNKKNSVIKFIIIVPIFFIIVTIITMSAISVSLVYKHYNSDLKNYTNQEVELQKQYIKNQIDNIYSYIEYKKTEAPKRLKEKLKNRVYMAYDLANNIYKNKKGKVSEQELKKEILETIRKVRFGKNGYYFIAEMVGDNEIISRMLPATPTKENISAYALKDIDGKYYVQELANVAKTQKEGYVTYKWYKLTKKEQYDKISFVKIFEPYNWFIGYGEYIDDFEKNIKEEALKRLTLYRYPPNGYIWTSSTDNILLEHPFRPDAIGKFDLGSDKKTGLPLNKLFIKEALLNPDGTFVEYYWNKPNEKRALKKIGYVKHIKDWNWVIGTGVYHEDINTKVKKLIEKEETEVNEIIFSILTISLILLLTSIAISILISKKINRNFLDYEESLKDKQSELEKLNLSLEEKVKEKTSELLELNEQLEIKVQNRSDEIKEKNRVLEEQSKMVALGEMIGNIAHQWRQPLSSISVAASGMKLKKELNLLEDEDILNLSDNIVKNTQYLSQVIDDFRNYIKGEKELVKFNINESVSQALSIFDSSINNHNLKIIKLLDDNIIINNYLNELIQALVNILNNAKDSLKEKQEDENKRIIVITTSVKDGKANISIKDSAGGIKDDVLKKVFEPYFTTKDKSQGTGLGLYMTYQIITDSMKGKIYVENSEFIYNNSLYHGANFIIELDKL
ncbi:MAG: cache domain-containing protein [Arcobacter sp.]|uniref:sensor histidine kinase n=1 Tax=Arcobacter sp. TaxID=1872629 RepID=UPI003B00CF03